MAGGHGALVERVGGQRGRAVAVAVEVVAERAVEVLLLQQVLDAAIDGGVDARLHRAHLGLPRSGAQRARRAGGPDAHAAGHVAAAVQPIEGQLQARAHVVGHVEGGLEVGVLGLALLRVHGPARSGRAVDRAADRPVGLGEAGARVLQRDVAQHAAGALAGAQAQLVEHHVAAAGAADLLGRRGVVRQELELQAGHAGELRGEAQRPRVGVRVGSAHEQAAVGLRGEAGPSGGDELQRSQRHPLGRRGGLGLGECEAGEAGEEHGRPAILAAPNERGGRRTLVRRPPRSGRAVSARDHGTMSRPTAFEAICTTPLARSITT